MRFTLSWLKDHLETEATLQEIVEALNKIGLEVSYFKDLNNDLSEFKSARVVEVKQHVNADRLKVCKVDLGSRSKQVVCGAPNVKVNMIGVFAPSGAYIPGIDLQLKKTNIRGEVSEGMLCSEKELEISNNHDGIIELPNDTEIGIEVSNLLGIDDPVIEIEITPNRGDCLGVRGIARDLSAYGIGNLKKIDFIKKTGDFESCVKWKLQLSDQDKDLCPKILGRTFRNLNNVTSPPWMRNRLQLAGLNCISGLVDITNYIMLDIGRPLHAYDVKKIKGNVLNVRLAEEGEKFFGLNNKSYDLDNKMLVIADQEGPDDLAGIMGGSRTGIDNQTSEMFLEAAIFSPSSVAQTGRKLNIVSDARYRFERGLDFEAPDWSIHYASDLITKICGGNFSFIDMKSNKIQLKKIFFNPKLVQDLIGIDIEQDKIIDILTKLGFILDKTKSNEWTILVPSWRNDIDGKADIVEEIIRIYGYDKIPISFLKRNQIITKPSLKTEQRKNLYIRKIIASKGFNEVITFSFLDKMRADFFNEGKNSLSLVNPISSELSQMRPSIIPNLIEAAQKNINKGFNNISFFEVGPIFIGDKPSEQLNVASGFRCGNKTDKNWKNDKVNFDFYDLKSDVLQFLDALCLPSRKLIISSTDMPRFFHPGRSASIKLGGKLLAFFGQLNPLMLNDLNFKKECFAFEIFLDHLPEPKKIRLSKPLLKVSPFQSFFRDFSFVVDQDLESIQIVKTIKNVNSNLLKDIKVFDIYKGENIPKDKKSISLSVEIQPFEQTMKDKEIELLCTNIISEVTEKLKAKIRKI